MEPAAGRLFAIRSLTPLITLQLLLCLGRYFDMNHIFSSFISKGPSRLSSQLGMSPSSQIGSVWSFSIKYYYLTPDEEIEFHGQDSAFLQEDNSLRIRRGCSLVALQSTEFILSSPPWLLLVLSCTRANTSPPPALNSGFEAYLWAINQEMTGARQSLR